MQSRPPLIIVSGAPGSGKTMLATALAADLRLPLIAKDDLKEALADAMGTPRDVAASASLGEGAYAAMSVVAKRVLDAGVGLVLESNFRRGLSESYLRPLTVAASARLVHCTAPPDVIQQRYASRSGASERHPAHLDVQRGDALAEDLAAGRFEPLDLGIPTLCVVTTDGYVPDRAAIRHFCSGSAP